MPRIPQSHHQGLVRQILGHRSSPRTIFRRGLLLGLLMPLLRKREIRLLKSFEDSQDPGDLVSLDILIIFRRLVPRFDKLRPAALQPCSGEACCSSNCLQGK